MNEGNESVEQTIKENQGGLWILPIILVWLVALGFYISNTWFPFGMMGGLATSFILSALIFVFSEQVDGFLGRCI